MTHDVTYEVVSILISHDVAVEVASLHEIVIGMRVSMAGCLAGYLKGWLQTTRIRRRTSKTVWPIVRPPSTIIVKTHEAVSLVAALRRGFRRIYRQKVIVGPQTVHVGIVVREETCLQHLI